MAKKWKISRLYVCPEASFGTEPDADGSDYTFLKASDISFQPTAEVIERPGQTGDFTRQPHVIGVKRGTLSFKLELKASGTAAASTVAAIASEASPVLLSALGTVVRGTGSVTSAATTTTLTVTVPGGFSKYMMIEVNSQVRFITSIAGSVLTLDRALTGAPSNGTVVYASSLFKRANTGHASLAFCCIRDDVQYTLLGCFATVKLSGVNAKGVAMLDVSVQCADWSVTSKASLASSDVTGITAVSPPVVKGAAFTVDGTEDFIRSFDFDPGHTFAHQETTSGAQAAQGIELTDAQAGGALKPYYSATHLTDFLAGTERALALAVGGRTTGWGVYIPKAQYLQPTLEEANPGMIGEGIPFKVNDNVTDPDWVLNIF